MFFLSGVKQELFFLHDISPGNCFFAPNGTFIYNTLVDFIKKEQLKQDFQEVISPNVYETSLWKTSGHWEHYSNDMFSFQSDGKDYSLKPMNCPGHCLIFHHKQKNYTDLPLRFSEFGVLHRNESVGTLSGLTRLRRFQQDDCHIFCRKDQIKSEINRLLKYLSIVYKTFGFKLNLSLSTRPDDFLGEKELWNHAEDVLTATLNDSQKDWKLNPKDGAFYGPKIDVTVTDALKRHHQCATIQLDFQLPIQFDLSYSLDDGTKSRPVIIHCAILGSIERMIAILTESYAGKWPLWLSPKQVFIVPISSVFYEYGMEIKNKLSEEGFNVSIGIKDEHMKQMIKKAVHNQYNFILVVGQKELENYTVNVRSQNNKILGQYDVNDFTEKLIYIRDEKLLDSANLFSKTK